MNSTMKITSLVAVLALCCAALAGSAYAYTATYMDTIEEQPIESVYVTINDSTSDVLAKYAHADVDVMYDTKTVKDVGTTYRLSTDAVTTAIYNGVEFTTADVNNVKQTVTFAGVIDAVALRAYGDDSTGDLTITVAGTGWATSEGKLVYSDKGVTAILSVLGPDGNEISAADTNILTVSGIALAAGAVDAKVCKLKITIVVDQLVVPAGELPADPYFAAKDVALTGGYLNASVTIPTFDATYKFTAVQA